MLSLKKYGKLRFFLAIGVSMGLTLNQHAHKHMHDRLKQTFSANRNMLRFDSGINSDQ